MTCQCQVARLTNFLAGMSALTDGNLESTDSQTARLMHRLASAIVSSSVWFTSATTADGPVLSHAEGTAGLAAPQP